MTARGGLPPTRIGFVIEQALGHITHTRNLQTAVPADPEVQAHWALIPFAVTGIAASMPLYASNWTVRAGMRSRRALGTIARRTSLDALFFHTQVTAILAATWVRRLPSVVSLDATPLQYDSLGSSYAHTPGPAWLERVKWRLNRDCYRDARHLVTWSSWARQGLIDEYEVPGEKVMVIPPGVIIADWRTPEPRRLHGGPVRILFVGGDLERKGGLVLLDAWRRINAAREAGTPMVQLHLVTKDAVPAELGLVVHHDMQPNSEALKELYRDSDIFCLPTYGDCLPMVLSEAGAAGLPAISTSVAAIGEITRDGETGFIVPPGDVEALAAALQRLIDNPELRMRMGESAVELVTRDFDAARNAQRLLNLLKHVATTSVTRA